MKNITKNTEPRSLAQHRCSRHSDYSNYDHKDDLRHSLLQEQGFICCFCMRRIGVREGIALGDQMKVAHWHSQTRHPDEDLDYANLLGACKGGEGMPPEQQHCDTFQGNRDLAFNPANPVHDVESKIRYLADGTMESDDPQLDRDINCVLNLNRGYRLKESRKAVISAVIHKVSMRPGPRTRCELHALIDNWGGRDANGHFKEFCRVALYYLQRKLARTR
ncbi:MAG TPA: hypothetical protein PLP78_03280 [Candidatus Fermentibacter daniensis]|nr:hypothetical protein [Candidatus Fermentibacter daniensis]